MPIVGLINNAAINPTVTENLQNDSALENYNFSTWDDEINVGMLSLICSIVFGACMAKNGYGSIINISSDLGLIAPDHRLYKNDKNGIQQYKPVSYSIINMP